MNSYQLRKFHATWGTPGIPEGDDYRVPA
jgi:hypothetical protein